MVVAMLKRTSHFTAIYVVHVRFIIKTSVVSMTQHSMWSREVKGDTGTPSMSTHNILHATSNHASPYDHVTPRHVTYYHVTFDKGRVRETLKFYRIQINPTGTNLIKYTFV